MASDRRKQSWLRHDAKRKVTPERKLKEKARTLVRYKMPRKKLGVCLVCAETKPTVWHHTTYDDWAAVIEVCHKCHRKLHPRPMPNGTVR